MGSFSISDVISLEGAIRITLEEKNMPGWFAELDLNAEEVAFLLDEKYKIDENLIQNGIEDRSGFSKLPRKLKSK